MRRLTDIHAYHEAGHAVASWLGSIKIDFVSIDTTSGGSPVTWSNEEHLRNLPPYLWQQQSMLIAWAGYAADLKNLRSINPDGSELDLSGYGRDQTNGRAILFGMKFPTKVEEFYRHETLLLFEDTNTWRHTELLAERLIISPTILRDEFETLMAELPALTSDYFASLAMRRETWWKQFVG